MMRLRRRARLKNSGEEVVQFRLRAFIGLAGVALLFGVLATRYSWLQVVRHEEFRARSEANRVKLRPIVPARGLIYDRRGVLLADNVPAYRLEVIPEQAGELAGLLDRLAEVVPLSVEERERFNELARAQRRFAAVPLKLRLTESQVAAFAVNRHHKVAGAAVAGIGVILVFPVRRIEPRHSDEIADAAGLELALAC